MRTYVKLKSLPMFLRVTVLVRFYSYKQSMLESTIRSYIALRYEYWYIRIVFKYRATSNTVSTNIFPINWSHIWAIPLMFGITSRVLCPTDNLRGRLKRWNSLGLERDSHSPPQGILGNEPPHSTCTSATLEEICQNILCILSFLIWLESRVQRKMVQI